MTSLELVWKPKEISFGEGFISQYQTIRTPIFPSLVYLRISLKRLVYGTVDEATGLVWPYDSKALLAEKLHNHTLPTIDRLLERIVPPTTEVTLSCSKWDWYDVIDMRLIEEQGVEKTKPQRADLEGLRCWREVPTKEGDRDIKAADQESEIPRRGYWIHVPIEDVHLDQGGKLLRVHCPRGHLS
jgi:hypothetical protein